MVVLLLGDIVVRGGIILYDKVKGYVRCGFFVSQGDGIRIEVVTAICPLVELI